MHAMVSLAESYIKNAVPAEKAAKIIVDSITSKRPRTRYTIGKDAAMVRFMNWILPDRMLDKLVARSNRSEEHTSELQSLMRISYAVFCLKKKKTITYNT